MPGKGKKPQTPQSHMLVPDAPKVCEGFLNMTGIQRQLYEQVDTPQFAHDLHTTSHRHPCALLGCRGMV